MEEQPAPPPTPVPAPASVGDLTARVASIVAAAEQSAARLREQAEQRARDRIAEADRASANRVKAAEDEAQELLAAARVEADGIREAARADARQTVGEAREAAREVLGAGTEISRDLEQLSASLRRNASVILKDAQHAHRELMNRIDRVVPPTTADRVARATPPAAAGDGSPLREPELGLPVRARRTPSSTSDAPPIDASDVPVQDIEIPEFTRDYVPQRHRRRGS